MELDRRAAEAASALRAEIDSDLDIDAAYANVLDQTAGRRGRNTAGRFVLGAAAAFAVLAGMALVVAALSWRTAPDRTDLFATDGDELTAAGAAILNGLPDGPLDGRESWRLPVVANPQAGVAEGDLVTLYGRGFQPNELVGAVHCASEADTASAGVDACDLGDEEYAFANATTGTARDDGSVVITVQIRRHINTPRLGEVDCASAAERCLLAIGAANDYDRSGGTYVNFAGAPEFPTPTVALTPEGPYTPGQEVTVNAGGLMPGRQTQVQQCVGEDHCAPLSVGWAGEDGTYAAAVVVGSAVLGENGQEVDCDGACSIRVNGVGLPEQTSAPMPDPIPIEVGPGERVVVGGEPAAPQGPVVDDPASTDPGAQDPGQVGPVEPGDPGVTSPSVEPEMPSDPSPLPSTPADSSSTDSGSAETQPVDPQPGITTDGTDPLPEAESTPPR